MTAILITGARVWDGLARDAAPGEILIEGNRIAAMATGSGRIERARAAQVVDAAGRFCMPGLVEAHGHVSFTDARSGMEMGAIPVEEHMLLTARNARLLLDHGFTSVFSAGAAKPRLDIALRNAIENGVVPGPRLRACSPELTVTGGLGDDDQWHQRRRSFAEIVDGAEAMRRLCRLFLREGVDSIKLNISGDFNPRGAGPEMTVMTDAEVAAAVETAHGRGRRVAAHCRAAASVRMALRHGVDVLYHCEQADAAALDLLEAARDRIFVAPALGNLFANAHESASIGISAEAARAAGRVAALDSAVATSRELIRRGVRVLPGGDYGFAVNPQGRNARDIGLFVRLLGLEPWEALSAATRLGGELMGLPGELGVLRPGALADLLLVDGDPLRDPAVLEDRTALTGIMRDGAWYRAPQQSQECG